MAKFAAVCELPKFIDAIEQVKRETNDIQVVMLIDEFKLPRLTQEGYGVNTPYLEHVPARKVVSCLTVAIR